MRRNYIENKLILYCMQKLCFFFIICYFLCVFVMWHTWNSFWLVWLNGSVFVYELSDYGFGSHCSHLNFRFRTVSSNAFPEIQTIRQAGYYKNCFFLSCLIEWNNLDSNVRNSASFSLFMKPVLSFTRSSAGSNFQCHKPKDLNSIKRLRIGLSHHWYHKF